MIARLAVLSFAKQSALLWTLGRGEADLLEKYKKYRLVKGAKGPRPVRLNKEIQLEAEKSTTQIFFNKIRSVYQNIGLTPLKAQLEATRYRVGEECVVDLTKKKEVAACIRARDEFDDVDIVFPRKLAFTLAKSEAHHARQFLVKLPEGRGEEEVLCTLQSIVFHDTENWPIKMYFNRYIPGRPNLLDMPIVLFNDEVNGDPLLKAQNCESLWVWCYNEKYPPAIEIDVLKIEAKTYFLYEDVIGILPKGIFLHEKHKRIGKEILLELYPKRILKDEDIFINVHQGLDLPTDIVENAPAVIPESKTAPIPSILDMYKEKKIDLTDRLGGRKNWEYDIDKIFSGEKDLEADKLVRKYIQLLPAQDKESIMKQSEEFRKKKPAREVLDQWVESVYEKVIKYVPNQGLTPGAGVKEAERPKDVLQIYEEKMAERKRQKRTTKSPKPALEQAKKPESEALKKPAADQEEGMKAGKAKKGAAPQEKSGPADDEDSKAHVGAKPEKAPKPDKVAKPDKPEKGGKAGKAAPPAKEGKEGKDGKEAKTEKDGKGEAGSKKEAGSDGEKGKGKRKKKGGSDDEDDKPVKEKKKAKKKESKAQQEPKKNVKRPVFTMSVKKFSKSNSCAIHKEKLQSLAGIGGVLPPQNLLSKKSQAKERKKGYSIVSEIRRGKRGISAEKKINESIPKEDAKAKGDEEKATPKAASKAEPKDTQGQKKDK